MSAHQIPVVRYRIKIGNRNFESGIFYIPDLKVVRFFELQQDIFALRRLQVLAVNDEGQRIHA